MKYTLQVAVEDCTGCGICVDVCPARNKSEARLKAINMRPQPPLRQTERENWGFFLSIPELDRRQVSLEHIRAQQVQQPLFEFSGACAGCGETPYLKLLSQLFGDRLIVANATGCSSIYGGNLPTTPWAHNARVVARHGATRCSKTTPSSASASVSRSTNSESSLGSFSQDSTPEVGEQLVNNILHAEQKDEADIFDQRERVRELKQRLETLDTDDARRLLAVADTLVRKSVWIVGGDGWAYDIGFGGSIMCWRAAAT